MLSFLGDEKEFEAQTFRTPEMNELETDKFPLKIWAHNFEKQTSYENFESRKSMAIFPDFWDLCAFNERISSFLNGLNFPRTNSTPKLGFSDLK